MKIFLSPSDQTGNLYTGFSGVSEADICRQIAQACFNRLRSRNDIACKLSLADTYQQRVVESNSWGADAHVCIHTNAGGGDGTVVFCYPGNQNNEWVKGIYDAISRISPGNDDGIRPVTNLYEINRTSAICVYLEVEFHDSASGAKWLRDHVAYIGETLADAIISIAGGKQMWYKVVVPATDENDAKLQYNDFDHFYVTYNGNAYFQIGAYRDAGNANSMLATLIVHGYDAKILRQEV